MSDKISSSTQIIIRKTNCDGIGNVFKGFISALSIHDNVVIECNQNYILGQYNTILEDTFIYTSEKSNKTDQTNEYFYTCRLLVLREEEPYQDNILNEFQHTNGCGNANLNHLFSFQILIDWNYDPSKICDQIKERIFNTIDKIRFKPDIIDAVEKIQDLMTFNKTLGISVRTWTASHEKNINRKYDFNTYKMAIEKAIETQDIDTIILSFDNHYVEPAFLEFLKTYENLQIFVLQKGEYNELQSAIIKILVLSKCSHLIANRISTFSELIFWFSKCKIQVWPMH